MKIPRLRGEQSMCLTLLWLLYVLITVPVQYLTQWMLLIDWTGICCNRTYSAWWNGQPCGKCHSMIQSAALCISVGATRSLIILWEVINWRQSVRRKTLVFGSLIIWSRRCNVSMHTPKLAVQCWPEFPVHFCSDCSLSWTPLLAWCSQRGSQNT